MAATSGNEPVHVLAEFRTARVAIPEWATGRREIAGLMTALHGAGCKSTECLTASRVLDDGYPDTLLVAIGNLNDSPLLSDLYQQRLAFIDGHFPGPGGFVVRLLRVPARRCNPLLIAGGSDQAGTIRAVRQLTRTLGEETPCLAQVQSSLLPAAPELHRIDSIVQRVISERLAMGNGYGPAASVIEWSFLYHLSAQPAWGALARKGLVALADGYRRSVSFGPYAKGMWEFFFLHGLISIWRLLETDALFTDSDRGTVHGLVEAWTEGTADSCYLQPGANVRGEIRQNHALCAAVSLLDAVEYLDHYGDVSGWRGAVEQAEMIVEGQLSSYRPNDDGGNDIYAWNNPAELIHLLLQRRDTRLFDSGQLARMADLAILCTDNRRDEVSFGDCDAYRPWHGRSHVRRRYVLGPAAWYDRNGAYQWAYEWLAEPVDPAGGFSFDAAGERWDLTVGRYASDVPAAYPQDYCGVTAVMLDQGALAAVDRWYADPGRGGQVPFGTQPPLTDGRPLPVDYARWRPQPGVAYFDKISFRPSFAPDDEYLLLQGPGTFCHSHRDANAIARLTWRDRIWLADLDYIRHTPPHHNLVHVVRDGHGAAYPPLARLERLCDFQDLGITRTKLPSLNGADWTRTIIWIPGEAFLVLDDLVITEPGGFQVECLWRPLGEISASKNHLHVRQGDLTFSIVSLPNPSMECWLTRERPTTKSRWDAYEHAGPEVQVWHESQGGQFTAGESLRFANMLSAPVVGAGSGATLRRLAHGLLAIVTKGDEAVCGTPREPIAGDGLEIEADALYWTSRQLYVVGARRLSVGACRILAPEPFDLEIDLATGSGQLYLLEGEPHSWGATGCRVGAPQPHDRGSARPAPRPMVKCSLHLDDGEAGLLRKAYDDLLSSVSPPVAHGAATQQNTAALWTEHWQRSMDASVTACALFDEAALFGDTSGVVHCVDPDGRQQWCSSLGFAIRALLVVDTGGGGQQQIAVGTDGGEVHLLSIEGDVLWSRALPPYHAFGDVQRVTALAALPGRDRQSKRLLVGTEGHHLFCLDGAGTICWHEWARYHGVTALAVGDLLGQGRPQIVLGNEYQTPINVFDGQGNLLWMTWEQVGSEARSTTVRSGTDARVIRLADVDQDGRLEIIYGTLDMLVLALDPADGTHLWKADVGGEVVGLEVWPGDDGDHRIATLTSNGLLWLLRGDGQELACRRLGRDGTALAYCGQSQLAIAGSAGICLLAADLSVIARLPTDAPATRLASATRRGQRRLVYTAGRTVGEAICPPLDESGQG
jgi:outer membrane protein assembly factor BamB